MKKLIVIIIFNLTAISIFAQTGTIKGRVADANNNDGIPFATVVIENTQLATTCDFEGNFRIDEIPPGFHKIRTQLIGYKPNISEDIEVRPNKIANVEIKLEKQHYNLKEVVVKGSPFSRKPESPLSMRSLGIREIEKTPGASRDISQIIQSLPGVSSGTGASFRNDVIVRGGGPSENVFFLEDVEIPNINHFSTQGASGGPIGIVNADFVSKLDFHSGAFPAYAGEALSSVLAFKLINGNDEKLKFKVTLGASDLALTADGPLGKKTTAMLSIRRSYLQYLFQVIGLPFLPTYNDYQFKTKTKFNKKNELTIISLGSLDDFEINTSMENPNELQKYIINSLPVIDQWSYVVGGVYKHFGKNGYSKIVLSNNYLNNEIVKYKDNNTDNPDDLQTKIASAEIETKFRIEQISRLNGFRFHYGIGYEHSTYKNDIFKKLLIFGNQITLDNDTKLDLNSWGLFGSVSRNFFNEKLMLSLSMRADANDYNKYMHNLLKQISPRFSASYRIFDRWYINANAGRYFKRPEYTVLGYKNRDNVFINKQNEVKYISSNQYVAGLEWQPLDNAKITGEFFYKTYQDYPMSVKDGIALSNKGTDYGVVGNEEIQSNAKGKSYGFELFVRMPAFKKTNIILSYTLVRSEFENIKKEVIPTAYDNRHIVNLILVKSLKRNWDIGIKWRYAGGTPYTPYDLDKSKVVPYWDIQNKAFLDYDKYNSLRLNASHRLDLRIDKTFFMKKWELGFYLDIQNLYNFKADIPPYITNLDENGNPNINPNNANEYILRELDSNSGSIVPTFGIKIAF